MTVEVRVSYNGKNYNVEREGYTLSDESDAEVVGFVREVLTGVISDIERLEMK